MIKNLKKITSCAITTVLLFSLAGCGGSSTDSGNADTDSGDASTESVQSAETEKEEEQEVTTIKVGTGATSYPTCFIDEDGNLDGFELDVLKAIDEELPQYEFEYEGLSFDDILTALDAGKIDVGAWLFFKTEEREKKYLYASIPYSVSREYLVVSADNEEVNSIDDLHDCTVNGGSSGEEKYELFAKYAEEHPDKNINVVSVSPIFDEAGIESFRNGTWEASAVDKGRVKKVNLDFGDGKDVLKAVGDPLLEDDTYHIFQKDATELQQAWDEALKTLKESGKIEEIEKKWYD